MKESDLKILDKEELIRLLIKESKNTEILSEKLKSEKLINKTIKGEIQKLKDDAQTAEKDLKAVKEELESAQEKLGTAQEEKSQLEKELGVINQATRDFAAVVVEYYSSAQETILWADEFLAAEVNQRIAQMMSRFLKVVVKNSRLVASFFTPSTESLKPAPAAKEPTESNAALRELQEVAQKNQLKPTKKLIKALEIIKESYEDKTLSSECLGPLLESFKIDPFKGRKKPEKQPSRGRQVTSPNLECREEKIHAEEPVFCEHDGKKMITYTEVCAKFYAVLTGPKRGVEQVVTANDVYVCPECGSVRIPMKEGQDHPLTPLRNLSAETVIGFAQMVAEGTPLYRSSKKLRKKAQLGKESVNRQVKDLADFYLTPLYELIVKAASEAPYLVADETRWQVIRDGENEKTKDKRGFHILCLAPQENDEKQFCLYSYINGRGKDEIKKVITPDYKLKALTTDGLSVYDAILEDHPEALHQSCWMHMRRQVIDALECVTLFKDPDPESAEFTERLKDHLNKGTDLAKMVVILDCIRKMYGCRTNLASLDKEDLEYEEKFDQNRKDLRILADTIDRLFTELSGRRVKLRGKKYQKALVDPYTEAVVYYLNHRESLRAFLSDPHLLLDSGYVERCIRPLTVARRSSCFCQSPEYLHARTVICTVFETLRLNNVEDPQEWLRNYVRDLYQHVVQETYKRFLDQKGLEEDWTLKSQPQGYDFKEHAKTFPIEKYAPWKQA